MQRAGWFSIRKSILAFAIIAPIWTIGFVWFNPLLAIAPLFVSHLLLLYPTLVPQSQWWGPVLRSFTTSDREVWMTIDDGPSAAHTKRILDLLDRYQARATFFVVGERVRKLPELREEILSRGHQIANHTFTHPSGRFWCALPGRIAAEIDRCNAEIVSDGNGSRLLFRAPAGLKNPFVHTALARRGMALIGWTARGFDTLERKPAKVAARILGGVCPGAILLLHEGHRIQSNPDHAPACLELTLRGLAERGYRCVIPRPEQLRPHIAGKQKDDC
jgi:peptidoglycan/xylan/chitin deacetylase (PgdA/CDA1 family)